MTLRKVKSGGEAGKLTNTTYSGRYFTEEIPEHTIPRGSMTARAAQQLIRDELNLDGNPALNLASFVTTWMEPEAQELATETLNRNFVDQDEYPQTEAIHHRVVSMMGRLFHAPGDEEPCGTATIGSSEAIMLGLLAHKHSWRARRGDDSARPNVVFGADVHTCWEKFARYFEVEQRVIPLTPDRHVIGPEEVEPLIDENTIAVGAILGTTFTGQIDDIEGIDELLRRVKQEKGWDIPIHVDGASGGFIAPFAYPEVKWDFRLEQVRSINVSNHKFGLVYPGMGSVLFRDVDVVPEELVFKINYLGGEMSNYSLNFSRASNSVLLQYYNFLRLGHAGYERLVGNLMENAAALEASLTASGRFELLNDARYLPVVVVRPTEKDGGIDVFELADRLRERGWIVPAYTLPPDAESVAVLRMVVKENFSRDMADMLGADIEGALAKMDGKASPSQAQQGGGKQRRIC
ncbi:MAG TPA: glutamate decarboxylase [Solirubrobacterales bacterium]|nr:glutamate decarboxylase [Solirubrobacterales bacterium]